jgi:molybdopterin/thiamine biosynthesis adenylyltransferase
MAFTRITDHVAASTSAAQSRDAEQMWSYSEAFARNLGLISREEQQRLQKCCVAIAGMGGVGGAELMTLARLGIGHFSIADPDVFEVANTNRQYGAIRSNLGRPKAEAMAEMVRDVNPEAEIRILSAPLSSANAEEFLRNADLFVDGIDFFEIDARRLMFRTAASMGIWGITAGPIGFSTAWLIFDPQGMSFDRYFDISDAMPKLDKLVAFLIGVCPKGLQMAYRLDLAHPNVELHSGKAPSLGLACQLAGAVVTTEAVKILLKRGTVRPVPYYHQFDPYVCRFAAGRLRGGNRHPAQRLKRWLLRRRMQGVVMT